MNHQRLLYTNKLAASDRRSAIFAKDGSRRTNMLSTLMLVVVAQSSACTVSKCLYFEVSPQSIETRTCLEYDLHVRICEKEQQDRAVSESLTAQQKAAEPGFFQSNINTAEKEQSRYSAQPPFKSQTSAKKPTPPSYAEPNGGADEDLELQRALEESARIAAVKK